MEIKTVDRIKQYLDSNGISFNAFDKAIGASNGYFGKQVKKQGSIGSDILEKIFCTYPDLNATWLLTGEGQMLRSHEQSSTELANTPSGNAEIAPIPKEKHTPNDTPTRSKNDTANDTATRSLGLPKVVTVSEDEAELISLVPHKASAGYLNGYGDPEYVETLPTIRMPNLGSGTHRAFEIKGHSMNPTLYNGSMSIGRWVESLEEIRDRRIYIVVTKSEGIVAKRVLNRVNESGKLILVSDNHNKKEYPNIILDASDVLELWYQRANLAFEFPEPDIIYNRMNDTEARLTLLEDKIKHLLK